MNVSGVGSSVARNLSRRRRLQYFYYANCRGAGRRSFLLSIFLATFDNMLNAIIVDDEDFARSSLYFLLQENCPDINIVGIAKSVAEARAILNTTPADVIFLDIAMPNENGFALLDHPAAGKAAIIFATAYDQYALRAIKANALDYILKPIDIEELVLAVNKAVNQKLKNQEKPSIQDHLNEKGEVKKLTLPAGSGYKIIDTDEIVCIEADSNYSVFTIISGEKITVSKVLKEFEEILDANTFFRIHKSTIVNFNYIKEYNSKNGLKVILINGIEFQVSRRRAPDFFDKIKAFTNVKGD